MAGDKNKNILLEENVMSKKVKKQTKVEIKKVEKKVPETSKNSDVVGAWIKSYVTVSEESVTAARLITKSMLEGGNTLKGMKELCKKFSDAKGGARKQTWGTKNNGDLLSHLRWLRQRSIDVRVEGDRYSIVA